MDRTDDDEFVSVDVAISRLIGEFTEHRVRQRALLDVLTGGDFSWDGYVDRVREVRTRDFDALFGAMVLQPQIFQEKYAQWIEDDTKRYLFRTDAGMDNGSPRTPKARKPPRKKR